MKLENFRVSIGRLLQKRSDYLSDLLDCYFGEEVTDDEIFRAECSFNTILRDENNNFDIIIEEYLDSLEKIKESKLTLRDLRLETFMHLDHANDEFLYRFDSWLEEHSSFCNEGLMDMYNVSSVNNTEHHQEIDNGLVMAMSGVFMPQDNCG